MSEIGNKPKQRGNPAWVKGGPSPNHTGRPGDLGEFREKCRSKSPQALDALEAALGEGGTTAVAAAKVLLEYGWGKPASSTEDLDALRQSGRPLAGSTAEEILAALRAKGETP